MVVTTTDSTRRGGPKTVSGERGRRRVFPNLCGRVDLVFPRFWSIHPLSPSFCTTLNLRNFLERGLYVEYVYKMCT